jgi:hypothetical protein
MNYLPGLALNCDPPVLSLSNSYEYRCEPLAPSRGRYYYNYFKFINPFNPHNNHPRCVIRKMRHREVNLSLITLKTSS